MSVSLLLSCEDYEASSGSVHSAAAEDGGGCSLKSLDVDDDFQLQQLNKPMIDDELRNNAEVSLQHLSQLVVNNSTLLIIFYSQFDHDNVRCRHI